MIDWAEEMKRVTRVMRERHEAVVMKRPRGLTKQHAIGTYIITPASTLHAAVMEDTRFVDLNLRIGTPYLFCHQGNCLHHMIVHEVRRIDRSFDVLNRLAYPLHVFQSKIRRKKCRICDTCPAKYVTYGDKMSPRTRASTATTATAPCTTTARAACCTATTKCFRTITNRLPHYFTLCTLEHLSLSLSLCIYKKTPVVS